MKPIENTENTTTHAQARRYNFLCKKTGEKPRLITDKTEMSEEIARLTAISREMMADMIPTQRQINAIIENKIPLPGGKKLEEASYLDCHDALKEEGRKQRIREQIEANGSLAEGEVVTKKQQHKMGMKAREKLQEMKDTLQPKMKMGM